MFTERPKPLVRRRHGCSAIDAPAACAHAHSQPNPRRRLGSANELPARWLQLDIATGRGGRHLAWVSFTTPVEQLQVDAPDRYTIRFGPDGRVAVKAYCNRGMTSYSVSTDRRLAFKPMALTRAACSPGSLSDQYVKEVSRVTSYFLKDGDLFLELPVDSGTLRFRRQA
jgi:heat shock protein HslJ